MIDVNYRNYPKEHRAWSHAKSRVTCKTDVDYVKYGGRGITMCDRWANSFVAFFEDMGERPDGTSIDRIDNNQGYTPENCRWATIKQQNRNRRSNRWEEIDGVTRTLAEWIELSGLKNSTVRMRINIYGWDIKKALTTKVGG